MPNADIIHLLMLLAYEGYYNFSNIKRKTAYCTTETNNNPDGLDK